MKKRFFVVLLALMGTFSVVFAYHRDIFADVKTISYAAGGNVTGRINLAPAGITGSNIGFQKGDKILMGTTTLENEELGWQLINYVNDPTYSYTNPLDRSQTIHNGVVGWLSLSTSPIKRGIKVFDNTRDSRLFVDTNLKPIIDSLNNKIASNSMDYAVLTSRYMKSAITSYENILSVSSNPTNAACSKNDIGFYICYGFSAASEQLGKVAYVPSNAGDIGLLYLNSENVVAFQGNDFENDFLTDYAYWESVHSSSAVGAQDWHIVNDIETFEKTGVLLENSDVNVPHNVRGAAYLSLEDVVFAVSKGTTNKIGVVSEMKLPSNYTYLKTATDPYNSMKVRIKDTSMNVVVDKNMYATNGNIIQEIGTMANFKVTASSTSVKPNSVISVVILNEKNEFVYYQPLSPVVAGEHMYSLDTTDMKPGTYTFMLVNEVYDDSSSTPVYSSELSEPIIAKVAGTPPLSALTISSATQFTYGELKGGDSVGEISTINGYGTPIYKILENSTYPGEDAYFEIATPTDHKANIVVKGNSSNKLDAGTYRFTIQAQDANGDPFTPLTKNVTITVTKATPTISLGSTSTAYIELESGAVSEDDYTISTTNTDVDFKPTLQISGDVAGLLKVSLDTNNPKKYIITPDASYTGSALPASYSLSYTALATKNFEAVTIPIKREFILYKKLSDLSWTQIANLKADQVNKAGVQVGSLQAVDGVGEFTYSIVQPSDQGYDATTGKDYASFQFDTSTGDKDTKIQLMNTGALIAKTYRIQVRVKDKLKTEKIKAITIEVKPTAQEELYFVNELDENITASGMTIKYTDTDKKLIAKGGSGNGAITYALADQQPSNIGDATKYLSIQADGTLLPFDIGTIHVMANKAKDDTHAASSVTMPLTIERGEQSLDFATKDTTHPYTKDEIFEAHAILMEKGAKSDRTITYSSSTMDVCTIDANGIVTMKEIGTCTIKAENTDAKYEPVSKEKTIEIYGELTGTFEQNSIPQAGEASGRADSYLGDINAEYGSGKKSYTILNVNSLFKVDSSNGEVSLRSDLHATQLENAWDADENAYILKETVRISDVLQHHSDVEIIVKCIGERIDPIFKDAQNGSLSLEYGVDTYYVFSLLKNTGEGNVTYTIEKNPSSELSGLNQNTGRVKLHHTSDIANPAIVKANIDPAMGYDSAQITAEVIVTAGSQSINFDAATPDKMQFKEKEAFSIHAELTRKDGSTGAIAYTAGPADICTNTGNQITMVSAGKCRVKAENKDENYEEAVSEKEITIYTGASGSFRQAVIPQAEVNADADALLGVFNGIDGQGTLTYHMNPQTNTSNRAHSLLKIEESTGEVSLVKDITASDLAAYASFKDGVYQLKFQIIVSDDGIEQEPIDCVIEMKGAPLKNVKFKGEVNKTITKTYGENNNIFTLSLENNEGRGTPVYTRKDDAFLPTDIIKPIDGNLVTIENANTVDANYLPDMQKLPIILAAIPAANGYEETTIEVKVSVLKAEQTSFKFRDALNIKSDVERVTPVFEGHMSTRPITMTSNDESIVKVDGEDLLPIKAGGPVTITATLPTDRNYQEKIITQDISVYDDLNVKLTQTAPYPQAGTESAKTDIRIGNLIVEGGQGEITREIMEGQQFVKLSSSTSDTLKLNKDITASDLAGTWNEAEKAYILPIKVKLSDSAGGECIRSFGIKFQGAPLPDASFIDEAGQKTAKLQVPYTPNGEVALQITGNAGNGRITYQLKAEETMPDDVLMSIIDTDAQSQEGTAYIENANDPVENANDVIVQAVIEPKDGYEGKTIECVVEITQAEQDFDFKDTQEVIHLGLQDSYPAEFTAQPKEGDIRLEMKDPSDPPALYFTGTTIHSQDQSGEFIITATAPGGRNYKTVIKEKKVIVYEDMTVSFTQSFVPQANTENALASANTALGSLTLAGGIGTIQAVVDKEQLDGAYFRIINQTTLIIDKDIDVEVLKTRWDAKWDNGRGGYILYTQLLLQDEAGNTSTKKLPIEIKGAPLSDIAFKGSDGRATYKVIKPYSQAPFSLELVNNEGQGEVTYKLKDDVTDMPSDVIQSVSGEGIVVIENANQKEESGRVMVEALISAKNGYDAAVIEGEIYIEQAPQPNFRFKEKEITLHCGASSDSELSGKLSSGKLEYQSDPSSIASVDENGTIQAGTSVGDAIITASVMSDRNYLSAKAEMIVHVDTIEEYPLLIQVPALTYGDSPVTAEIRQQGASGANLTQEWEIEDEEIATVDEFGRITIHHAGETILTLRQTSDGEPDVSASVVLSVKPKPIQITIEDKEKYVGEDVPDFTIAAIEGLVGEDVKTFVVPTLTCKDANGEMVHALSPARVYKIKGTLSQDKNPDYTITRIYDGTLKVKEDESSHDWYFLQSEAVISETGWYNKAVDVYLEENTAPYDQIGRSVKGPWSDHFRVDKEGIQQTDIYFRNSVNKAIASKQEREIKIDYHAPVITSITGTSTNTSTFARIVNTLTLDTLLQPGADIEIVAEDPKPADVSKVSGIKSIQYRVYRIIDGKQEMEPIDEGTSSENPAVVTLEEAGSYEVCALASDHAGNVEEEACQAIEITDTDGKEEPEEPECKKTDIKWTTIDEEGNTIWHALNEDRNHDGIPDRNIDRDGDGEADINIDTDNDGLPDLNLMVMSKEVWKPTKCVTQHGVQYESGVDVEPLINVDTNDDLIPDINIDIDGDMKADINVSKDGMHPYLNIAIVHEPWLPETKYVYQGFVYDTQVDFERYLNIDTNHDGLPDVNIDLNGDGIADLNIDTTGNEIPNVDIDSDGDGKPDVNLDTNGDGIPDEDIMEIKEWNPTHTVEGDIDYGTSFIERLAYLENQGIQVEKPNDRFLPNYALRVQDVTNERKGEIASMLSEEGREIVSIYEVDLLKDGVKVQPDGKLLVKIPVVEGLVNPSILLQMEDGNYQAVHVEIIDGYYNIETEYLGIISILKEEITSNQQVPVVVPNKNIGGAVEEEIKTKVAGSFTGDDSHPISYFIGFTISSLSLLLLYMRKKA